MHPVLAMLLLLVPFILWDLAAFLLRRRGDDSPERRERLLCHFTEEELVAGRHHVTMHNRLVPISRALFYFYFLALLPGGLGSRLEEALLLLLGGYWVLALPAFVLCILLFWTALHLPLDAYRELVIEHDLGLSTTSFGLFVADRIKGFFVSWVLVSVLAFCVLGLVRALPSSWPMPAAAALLGIGAFLTWISPWFIAPLFNKFTKLQDEALEADLRALVTRAGLKLKLVFVMDASRRSNYLNAYFTGLGNSRRVVLYDTLVKACPPAEILSVVAHELGHWRGRHIAKSFIMSSAGLVLGLLLLKALLGWGSALALLGFSSPDSLVLLVALPFLSTLTGTLTAPLGAALSRRFEREADQAAFELTGDPQAFISLEQRLVRKAQADLLTPKALHWWYASHPLPEDRIAAAQAYSGKRKRSDACPPKSS